MRISKCWRSPCFIAIWFISGIDWHWWSFVGIWVRELLVNFSCVSSIVVGVTLKCWELRSWHYLRNIIILLLLLTKYKETSLDQFRYSKSYFISSIIVSIFYSSLSHNKTKHQNRIKTINKKIINSHILFKWKSNQNWIAWDWEISEYLMIWGIKLWRNVWNLCDREKERER